ncbi:MAG: tandem-95 repeat protein, partial [Acidimicrobiia bacterium]|nr:tandem-95 repeat protein [Acidimicrobiia bacterium]
QWGVNGTGSGQFDFPRGIAVDPSGRVLVADSFNDRVQIFDADWVYLDSFGVSGAGPGQFTDTYGLAFGPSGDLYVGDIGNTRMQRFSAAGLLLNDVDPDMPGDTLTITLNTDVSDGTLVLNPDGSFTFDPDPDFYGTDSFVYLLCDSTPTCDTATVFITVDAVNDAPSFTGGGNVTVNEDSGAYSAPWASAISPGPANESGQVVTFTITGNTNPALFSAAPAVDGSGALTFATAPNANGVASITIEAGDDGGTANGGDDTSPPVVFTITVDPLNDPPTLDPIGNQATDEGVLLAFTATASDPDDIPPNGLTFSLSGGVPAGASITAGGAFTWTPTEAQGPGLYTFDVVVTETNGSPTNLSDSETISVTVNEVNVAPVADPIADQNVDEGTLVSLTATATDSDVPANSLSWSLDSGPGGVTAGGAYSWTPGEADGPGTYTVVLRVTDDGVPLLSDTVSFDITVNEVNVAPVADPIADQNVDEGTRVSLTATATDSDVPANTLSWSVDSGPGAITAGGAYSWTPAEADGPGTYTVVLRVTDSGAPAMFDTVSFDITVNEVNAAPVLGFIGNRATDEQVNLSFTAVATDPDIPANTLTFSLSGAVPAGASITPGGAFSWTPTETQGPGMYTFDVVVTETDGSPTNLSDSETISVTVGEANVAPTLDPIGNQSVDEQSLLSFTATASDPDLPANTLLFSLVGAPAGAIIDPNLGDFTWTPTEGQGPGVYVFDVVVTDNGSPNLNDSETISVTVGEVNVSPVLDPVGPQAGAEGSSIGFTATASDADLPANGLTFSLEDGAGSVPPGASITGGGVFTWTPTEAQGPGLYTFDVVVTDDGLPNLQDRETITVSVSEANNAPVADPIADRFPAEGDTVSLTATASDGDVPANTLTWSQDSGPGAVDATGNYSWTTTEGDGPGTYTVVLRVTDDGVPPMFDTVSFDITVGEVNIAPVADPIPDQTIDELSTVSLTATASDADVPANSLNWSLDSGPGSVDAAGNYSWTPAEVDGPGTYTVVLRVTDSGTPVLFDTVSFDITVNEVNGAPAADPIADQFIDEGDTVSLTATATDADVPANTLNWSLDSGPGSVDAAGNYSWTTGEADGPGTYTVVLRATDDGAPPLFDTVSFDITVAEVNTAPTPAPIADRFPAEGDTVSLTATATDPDLPANTLTWTKTLGPGAIDAAGNYSWTPTEADGPGFYGISLQVSDGTTSSTVGFTIVVGEVNEAPVLDPIGPRTGDELTAITFTATATDVDLPANGLAFTLEDGSGSVPPGAAITTGGSFAWTPSESQGPGVYTFDVVVTDDGSPPLKDRETITITVDEVDTSPTLTPVGNRSIDEGDLLTFVVTSTDPDVPSTQTYSLEDGPGLVPAGAAIDPLLGLFGWPTTEADGPAVYTFDVVVTDNTGLRDTETISITVNERNEPPVLDPIGDASGDELSTVAFTATASDADLPPNTLTFSLSGAPGGASIGSGGDFSWTPTEVQGPGIYTFDVVVTDDASPSAEDRETITITVDEVNEPPVLDPIGDRTVDEETALIFAATASDPDLPGNELTFSMTAAPPGAFFDAASGLFTWTPDESQGPGSYPVTFRVSDSAGASDEESVTITVNHVNTAPVLEDPGGQIDGEGLPVDLAIVGSDDDVPADALTWAATGLPDGLVIDPATGAISGVVADGAAGLSPFGVTVAVTDDGTPALEDSVTFVWVIEENSPPEPAPDFYELAAGASVTVGPPGLLANDVDPDGDPLTVTVIVPPAAGTLTVTSDGGFTYTHNGSNTAEDVFVYQASDGRGGSALATVKFSLLDPNLPPLLVPDVVVLLEDSVASVLPLANDSDPNGDALSLIDFTQPEAGTLTAADDGSLLYVPPANYFGEVTATYRVVDGNGGVSTGVISLIIESVNDLPVGGIDRATLASYLPITLNVLANDSDLDGDALFVSSVGAPLHGEAVLNADGTVTYRPDRGFVGTDRFTYVLSDALGAVDSVSVSIDIPDNALAAALQRGEDIGSPTLGFQAPPSDLDDGPTDSFSLVQGVTLMVEAFFQSLSALRLPILFLGLALGTVVVLGGFTEVPILLATRRRRYYSVVNLDREHRLAVHEEPDAESPPLFFYEPTAAGFRSLDKPSDDWVPVESPNGSGWVQRDYLTEATDLQFFLDDDRPVQMLRRLAGDLTSRDIAALFSERGLAVALTNDPHLVGAAVVQDALAAKPATADGIELLDTVLAPLRAALQAAADLDSRDSHSGTALIPVELWNFQYLAVNTPGHPPWLVYFEYVKGKPKIVGVGLDV